ncbi:MAG: hypothetical protein NT096_00640 [Proteobacteria bacterium]|nr:hypothetical protein [Pseudomonadota bacterium]
MNQYKKTFSNRHVLLPVIHVISKDQALKNASIAREAGCEGIFLINHGMPFTNLLEIHHAVFTEFSDWWIGVNCLDLTPKDVFHKITNEVAGVWVDNAMIDEQRENQPEAESIQSARIESGWKGLYFGGVAFKYQRPVQDLDRAARLAVKYMDVVTTSGPGTGQAAFRGKILAMKKVLGDFPLAIASGIRPANIYDYMDVADCFLVATGISISFTELDSNLLKRLVRAIRSYSDNAFPITGRNMPQKGKRINSVCFVCEWNEGRSIHLELSTRRKLMVKGGHISICSAGFRQGRNINPLRKEFLLKRGVPLEEIEDHKPTIFGKEHTQADLILVAELPMKARLLAAWPELQGKVMTVRGFIQGFSPENEPLSLADAHIEDAGGHSNEEKIALYIELEKLAEQIASRILELNLH